MSLIISVYVNEGIVMASDSRLTLNVSTPIIDSIVSNNAIPFSDTTKKYLFALINVEYRLVETLHIIINQLQVILINS